MASDPLIPDTRVLAIASHVVHGYVGNKMATFVMQSLGCDVSAINTVHYSNHTGYKQFKGTKTTADQIEELYEGLRQSNLNSFDLLLTGYMPSAETVQTVGKIGRDLKYNAVTRPGSFFWVLDPVMGDNGKLYIPEDVVPQYKALLREADLILPNQFEAELLSGTSITDLQSLAEAIQVLHKSYQIPHVIITSLRLTRDNQTLPSRPTSKPTTQHHTPSRSPERSAETSHPSSRPTGEQSSTSKAPASNPSLAEQSKIDLDEVEDLTIIGSTATSDFTPRLFRIDTPALPLFFSGTGDMFAALTIPRLIEAVKNAPSVPSSSNPTSPSTTDPPSIPLSSRPSWKSPDDVPAEDLPLAQACQKVLASMQAVLAKTAERCEREMKSYDKRAEKEGCGSGEEDQADTAKRRHLALTNASEVKVVRHVRELMDPPNLERFRARRVVLKEEVDEKTGGEDKGSEQGKIEEKQNGKDVKNAKADVQKSEGETEIETQEKGEEKPSQAVGDS